MINYSYFFVSLESNSAQLESDSELKQYMDQMDRELQGTTLGQSFIKKKPKVNFLLCFSIEFFNIKNFPG